MDKPKSFYSFGSDNTKIRVFFYHPQKTKDGYESFRANFTIDVYKLEDFLSRPNRIDYAFEATKICIIQKFHKNGIDKDVVKYLKDVDSFRKEFYESVCDLLEYVREHGYEVFMDNSNEFEGLELENIRFRTMDLTEQFIEIMR